MFDAPTEAVELMHAAVRPLADGHGILAYRDLEDVTSVLSRVDRLRFNYPSANDPEARRKLGSMPTIDSLLDIIEAARDLDDGLGATEDVWNSDAQLPLLRLACRTSKHQSSLAIDNVKNARIGPPSLARSSLPKRAIDYVVVLKQDARIREAYRRLPLLPGAAYPSWNHTDQPRTCETPIAINIETKGARKSWTDGKPQIAIWVDAWLNRLSLLNPITEPWPAIPLLIAQGHDWHLLILSRTDEHLTFWEKIDIGSTRTCFDAMRVIAVLHWIMDWAATVWKPWILSLVP